MRLLPIGLARWLAVFFLVGSIAADSLHAAPVIFAFRGTVTDVTGGFANILRGVAPGVPYRGFYVFDSNTPNTAPPGGEGEFGLYEHRRPPAGVYVSVGRHAFFSRPLRPDFSVIVNNDVGFAGSDDYGFESKRNVALPRVPADRLEINWHAQTFNNQLFSSSALPLDPPDLNILGGGMFSIYAECTPCASPNAFFNIQGTMTSLTEVGGRGFHSAGFSSVLGDDWTGQFTSANAVLVPEPTAAVVGIGLLGLILPRMRKRSR
jgi:hypothetical protein